MCKKVNPVLYLDLLVASNRNHQYLKRQILLSELKDRNTLGLQEGLEPRTRRPTSFTLSVHCFLLFLVHMVEYAPPYPALLLKLTVLSHTDTNFLILIPISWEVESDWPSPGPAMFEDRVLKYISPVGNLFLWIEKSCGDRRDSSQSKCGDIVSEADIEKCFQLQVC